MTDAEKLLVLKDLLLAEDRSLAKEIFQKLDVLEKTVYVETNLSDKISPIVERKIKAFADELDKTFGPSVSLALSEEVQNSQEKIVDILFPIIGKMIKKFVAQEMKTLSDSINAQMKQTFSVKTYTRKFKSIFSGVSENDMILAEISKPDLQQVFIIEKGSGIIIGSYSKTATVDADMVAGMLTAIKSFVEDAFNGGGQSLENIEYELYTIQIQNFSSYYIAAVLSGSINNFFKSKIQDDLLEFADKYITNNLDNQALINEKLEIYFDHE